MNWSIVPEETKKKIYTAIVQSRLQYGIATATWGAAGKTKITLLEKVQKKFIKILYCEPKRYNTQELFKNTNILAINQLHEINTLKYIKKVANIRQSRTPRESNKKQQYDSPTSNSRIKHR